MFLRKMLGIRACCSYLTCSMAGNVEVDIHHFKTEWYQIHEEVDITWCLPHPRKPLTANVNSVPFIKTWWVSGGAVFMLGAYKGVGVDVEQRDRCGCCNYSDRPLWKCTECGSPVCAHCIHPRLKKLLGQCKDCPSRRRRAKDEIEPQPKRMPSKAYRTRRISEVKTESAAVSTKRRRLEPVTL